MARLLSGEVKVLVVHPKQGLACIVFTPVNELPSGFGHASSRSRSRCGGTGLPVVLMQVQG